MINTTKLRLLGSEFPIDIGTSIVCIFSSGGFSCSLSLVRFINLAVPGKHWEHQIFLVPTPEQGIICSLGLMELPLNCFHGMRVNVGQYRGVRAVPMNSY